MFWTAGPFSLVLHVALGLLNVQFLQQSVLLFKILYTCYEAMICSIFNHGFDKDLFLHVKFWNAKWWMSRDG